MPILALLPMMSSSETGPEFRYNFSWTGTLEETASSSLSPSPYFWLRSGAKLMVSNGTGKTKQGSLAYSDPWRIRYNQLLPVETDKGYRPQNVFEVLTKDSWKDAAESLMVKLNRVNLSNPENRHAWNGVSLFSRYQDDNNFYYAGIRQDGTAVIKKKRAGTYTTLAQKPLFPGTYSATTRPNLIPLAVWIGLKHEITTKVDGSVSLKFFVKQPGQDWKLAAEAIDASNAIQNTGHGGFRSDFADAEFDNYEMVPMASATPAPAPTPAPVPVPAPEPTPIPEPAPEPPITTTPNYLFSDAFNYPDGVIADGSTPWDTTSGTAYAKSKTAWTNSDVFRIITDRSDFKNVAVAFDLKVNKFLSPSTGWHGVHIFLRYQSQYHLYYATIARPDGKVVLKKKMPGGPSNGGTYYELTPYISKAFPTGQYVNVKATVRDVSGGVEIKLYANGELVAAAVDKGTGGAPITNGGKTGVRADYTDMNFDNFTVSAI